MKRTQISLSEEEYLLAKKEAKRRGISLAELLRQGIRAMLPIQKEKSWMRYRGFVETGNPDANQSIDDIVYGHKD